MNPCRDVDVVAAWLARRDVEPGTLRPGDVDVVVLLGSSVLATVDTVVDVVRRRVAGRVVVSGGVGHSTADLAAAVREHPEWSGVRVEGRRTEAEVLADLLARRGVLDPLLETASTNCGANAQLTVRLLDEHDLRVSTVLLVQDPTMQRRTHACFERSLVGRDVRVDSLAPFVPRLDDLRGAWSRERFLSLVVGEVTRLRDDEHGHGPRGADFIDHVDVPAEVLAAYESLVTSGAPAQRAPGA